MRGSALAYTGRILQVQGMTLPIRIRLTIGYLVIFSLAGILLCCASYMMARRSLYIAVDHDLDEHIDDVRDFFAAHHLGAGYEQARSQVSAEFGLKDDGKWLQIRDDQGRWIFRSRRMMLAPHDIPFSDPRLPHGSISSFTAASKKVRSLVRSFPAGGHVYFVESGITLTKTDQILVSFRNGLLWISPAIFLVAGLGGHLLSRRALNPVAAIARQAQQIHDGNLQTRLPQMQTRDELAHLSSTLNEMLERIESGVRSVRDFTAYASHELRTPITLIRSEADLALQFARSNDEYREAIGVIRSEAQRMSSLIDSLLFLARADGGTEQVQLQPVDARRLCRQIGDKWRPLLQRAQVQVTTDLPSTSVHVLADPLYLQRLLTIVVENAAKYTPAGGSVRLTLQTTGGHARIEVSDTGIGIPVQDRGRIFERFYRGSNVQLANAHGSGLGLALAAWIAERHKTTIEVHSVEGKGSRFSWILPFTAPSSAGIPEQGLVAADSSFHPGRSIYGDLR
jgi:signal transduction histidine kinase